MNKKPTLYRSTKKFEGYPCTHRQWKAESHCRFVHGYSRSFGLEFACSALTTEGWVMDFGGMKEIKQWLEYMFDHTFLIAQDDPEMKTWEKLHEAGTIQLRVMPNPGMEGTAEFVYNYIIKWLENNTGKRVWVTKVEVRENEKNSGIFVPACGEGSPWLS